MSNRKTADVCIIVPNYNNARYLDAFIQSVTSSTVLPKTLLIVDDGSTDNSREVLEKHAGLPFLKTVYFEENRGLTSALNAALDAADAKYIMRADPDDLLHPERIERQFLFMESHPEVDILGCNVIYFRDDNKQVNASNFPTKNKKIVHAYRRGEHGLQHPTAFIRSEVFQQYRYQPIFPGEDYELLARMAKDGRVFANLDENLYYMRVHTGSSTTNLKFKAIENTFLFRDRIFEVKTTWLRKWLYFNHIRYYRKYQMAQTKAAAYLFLVVAILFYPRKFFRRLLK